MSHSKSNSNSQTKASTSSSTPSTPLDLEVVVHPLVLLSAVDHYNRLAKSVRNKRVVGALLGETFNGQIDISNSFAVPFEEDAKDPTIWFLDHNYLENMFGMFRKVNAKETIVGFYSTGPKITQNDIQIDNLFRSLSGNVNVGGNAGGKKKGSGGNEQFSSNPVFVIIDVRPEAEGIPTKAYISVDSVDENKATKRTFQNIGCRIGAYEAEEVGVEHLLRDINDPTVTNLAQRVKHKMSGLETLEERLGEICAYLDKVGNSESGMQVSNEIVYNLQTLLNLLPNLEVESLVKALFVKTNDMHLVVYVASLVRSIIALHELLNNQVKYEEYSAKLAIGNDKEKEKPSERPAPVAEKA